MHIVHLPEVIDVATYHRSTVVRLFWLQVPPVQQDPMGRSNKALALTKALQAKCGCVGPQACTGGGGAALQCRHARFRCANICNNKQQA